MRRVPRSDFERRVGQATHRPAPEAMESRAGHSHHPRWCAGHTDAAVAAAAVRG